MAARTAQSDGDAIVYSGSVAVSDADTIKFLNSAGHLVSPTAFSITVTGSTSFAVELTCDQDVAGTSEWVAIENSPFTADMQAAFVAPVAGLKITNSDITNPAVVRVIGKL